MRSSEVDRYISDAPPELQGKLRQLRRAILDAVPEATERISYGMPYYHYHGRLAYFGLAKRHIGLYIPSPVIDEHTDELKDFHAVQATVHLPLDQDLPIALVQKLVRARARMNETAAAARATQGPSS